MDPKLEEQLPEDETPTCSFLAAHPEAVAHVRAALPEGDSTRCKILFVLLVSEMCVCDLSQLLGMSVSAISHQLRILRQAQLVRYRRAGKTVFYALADEHVRTLLSQGMEHIQE